ncbi:MAG: PQQ-binding-like beta-propeller repeat protein [Acidobacteriota bacterium]
MLLSRFVLKLLIPGFEGFKTAMMGSLLCVALFFLWWLFASRAAWIDRIGGLLLAAGALAGTAALGHESMGPHWLAGYGIPFLCVSFLLALLLTRSLGAPARRAAAAALVVGLTGLWLLVRTDGIDGDHDSQFAWRFQATAEQQMLSPDGAEPQASPATLYSLSASDVGEWSGFRGPARDGVIPDLRIATDWTANPPAELWRRPVGPGWSSAAVAGGLLVTQEQRGEEEVVAAYDLLTGEPRWRHGDPVRFFESNAGAGPRATPTLHRGKVFALGATGVLNALSLADGSRLWSRNLLEDSDREIPDWGFSGSPLALGDRVFVPAAGQLVAYDAETGERLWLGPDSGGYSSPQLFEFDGERAIVMLGGDGLHAFNEAGDVLFHHEWGGFPMTQPAQLTDGGVVFSAHEAGGTRRLDISRAGDTFEVEERWTSLRLKPYFNDFVIHGDHAYGFDGRILAAVDLESGERAWKGGRYGSGQLVLLAASDALLVLSEQGDLALVRATPDGYEELAKVPALDGKTWNHPTVAGDVLIVRNAEEMVAFRLPLASGQTAALPGSTR